MFKQRSTILEYVVNYFFDRNETLILSTKSLKQSTSVQNEMDTEEECFEDENSSLIYSRSLGLAACASLESKNEVCLLCEVNPKQIPAFDFICASLESILAIEDTWER
ncbi:hypothetical protein Tco_0085251 [Tanacetum coccineum]